MSTIEKARIDTRLSKDLKDSFELVASIEGFRNLTEFVIYSLKKESKSIIDKHNRILASKKDSEIFFNALINSDEPNQKLKFAMSSYQTKFNKL